MSDPKADRDAAPGGGGVALSRSGADGIVGGVLAGLGRRYSLDPLLLRVGFVLLVFLTGGLALIAYVVAWVALPSDAKRGERWLGVAPGGWKVAAGAALLALAALLAFRELGIWWSDALVWPFVLAAAGAALLWRQTQSPRRRDADPSPRRRDERPRRAGGERERTGARGLYGGGFGIALVVGAAILFLYANGAFEAASDAALAAVVAILALTLILAPFLWRLGRNLAAERAERIRSQERAEVAAHLHDSVLQTLALVQRRAGDPREVAALARRQERELRAWLSGGAEAANGAGIAASLGRAAVEVEDTHGVPVETVIVGDAPLDERGEAVVAAAREAMVNAAKFAPDAGPVALYGEFEDGRAEVYVRDRGPGFDRDEIPPDRRGLRESIVGRMSRHGGSAEIRTAPGEGTEVRLEIPIARSE